MGPVKLSYFLYTIVMRHLHKCSFLLICFYASALLFCLPLSANAQTDTAAVSKQLEQYNTLVSRYRYDKPDSASFFANQGLRLARQYHNANGEAMMLNQLGMIDDNVGRFDDSRKKYLRALSLYSAVKNTKGMATENIRLGVVEMRKGNYDNATGYFLAALDISEHNGNLNGQMEAYITLGEAYAGQKKYDKALDYYHMAERLNNQLPFSNLSLNLFNDIGISYRETNRLENAKPYLLKGIALSNVPQYQGLNITLTNTLASVYAKGGDKKRSIALQLTALQKARKINNYIRQIQTLTGLATNYGKQHPDSALYYWKQALQLSDSKNAYKEQVDELNAIADIYQHTGDYKAAFAAKQRQYQLADDFFYKKMSKQIESLQNAYELNQSKARVQQLRFANKQQRLERKAVNVMLTGSLLVLSILAIFYHKTRRLNNLLNRSNTELQESNTVKDKLFSILGHDLRSPFISVLNLLEIIDDEDLEPEQRKELIGQLQLNSRTSLETLDGLLRWGQKQIKGIPVHQTTFLVKPVIDRTMIFLSGVADDKSIQFINSVNEDLNVHADLDHFEFIIRNLLSNAIKFSKAGSPVLVTGYYDVAKNQSVITVKDSGIGIEQDKLAEIFDLNNISTRGTGNEKGTSLGLLLCKEYIETNGGSIAVKSTPGVGSEFLITLNAGDTATL